MGRFACVMVWGSLVTACHDGAGAMAETDSADATASGDTTSAETGGSGNDPADETAGASEASQGSDDGSSSEGVDEAPPPPTGFFAVASNGVIGLDWDAVPGATGYRIYWSTQPGVTPQTGAVIEADAAAIEHRKLDNGTKYHYVITAVGPGGESSPSAEIAATPGGQWVLEQFGSGVFDDVLTGEPTPKVPVDARLHVLLFAEGYTASDLSSFHDDSEHDGDRSNDVDAWVDLVFGIEPYATFSEAFVVWYLPAASNTTIRAANPDTAFAVPVDASGSFAQTLSIPTDGETASRAWAELDAFPFPPTDFSGGGFGTVRAHTAAFLIFDPNYGRASVSGRATTLRNPADPSQRLSSAFGVGHAHEFTHAFAALRDEYLENDNSPPQYSPTSNVVGTDQCAQLPWAHLLAGHGFHDTDGLVGAFGVPSIGFHAELLCLMNGTHDNAQYYGGSGLLRVEDRMCNFCREITTYRIFQRSGTIEGDEPFTTWVDEYREPFFVRFGVSIPDPVPQTNDVDHPDQGDPIYEACVMSALVPGPVPVHEPAPSGEPHTHGCVTVP